MIKRKVLGKTNIEVSAIGFGGAPIGDLFEKLDEQVCYDTLKISHKNDINFFDTSPLYHLGRVDLALKTARQRGAVRADRRAHRLHHGALRQLGGGHSPHRPGPLARFPLRLALCGGGGGHRDVRVTLA